MEKVLIYIYIYIYIYTGDHLINKGNFLKKDTNIKKIFFHECKLDYFEGIYTKNYFNLTKIFLLKLFKMAANQTGLVSLFNGISIFLGYLTPMPSL